MSDPREQALAEAIKNKMIGILNAEDIFPGVAKLREKILNMSNREMERVSRKVASKVCIWIRKIQSSGKKPTGEIINRRVKMELERL